MLRNKQEEDGHYLKWSLDGFPPLVWVAVRVNIHDNLRQNSVSHTELLRQQTRSPSTDWISTSVNMFFHVGNIHSIETTHTEDWHVHSEQVSD